ncbi:MAG: hypothetical protein Q7K55_02105 [Candidatus Levybacteria bacterium]|nr:hypothetical protein [Candidatus Levybacteria bacterium]
MNKLVIFLLLIFMSLFQPQTIFASPSPLTVEVSRLTSGFYREDWPMIYKDTVYWSTGAEIYGLNIKNNESVLLTQVGLGLPSDYFAPTAYDGRFLIYNTYTVERGYNVEAYDFVKNNIIKITDEVGSNTATDYDQNIVAYVKGGACGSLYAYDLIKKTNILVTNAVCGPARISKKIIVWNETAAGGTNVYGYDLRRKQKFDIATGNGFQESPDIYNNLVVYTQYADGSNKFGLYYKDLNKGTITKIEESSDYSFSWPSIGNRYIVWGKNTAPHVAGIEGYSLKSGEVFEIQAQGPHQNGNMSPIIDHNIAAWMAWRTGNGDIYRALIGH